MRPVGTADWCERNRRYLMAAVARVRLLLERRAGGMAAEQQRGGPEKFPDRPPALEILASLFDLLPFERDVLVLCVAVELDSTFSPLCSRAQWDPRRGL